MTGGAPERLRARLAKEQGLLRLPGAWDPLTALLIERAGFGAAFVSGAALSMAGLGRADLGLVTPDRVIATVSAIADRTSLPLVVDGDTGFGNALTLRAFVRGVERAGAAAVVFEDQTFPKRCGHMAGKQVVPVDEAVGRIAAALDARTDLLIVARTDALAVEGLESAIERAARFVEAGADLVFVEGPRTMAELEAVCTRFAGEVPLVHNLVDGGVTPTRDGKILEALGISVALHPLLLMGGLTRAAPRWLAALADGRTDEDIDDLHELNTIVGASELLEEGARFGC